jgi:TolA-binding protein
MRIAKHLILILVTLNVAACSWLPWGEDDEVIDESDPAKVKQASEAEENEDIYVKPSTMEELELKLAKLWARVDELEETNYRQKEKIRVLERGLMLGVVPEEIKNPGSVPPPKKKKKKKKVAKKDLTKMTKKDTEEYQKMLAEAHASFRKGRYGKAIKDYSAIGEKFGEKLPDGMHNYWIARCWANLKEFNIAHQRYVEFIQEYPGSNWIPRAKLDKARVELNQGLRETAIGNFRKIIGDYPYEDVAEMARMELENMEKTL